MTRTQLDHVVPNTDIQLKTNTIKGLVPTLLLLCSFIVLLAFSDSNAQNADEQEFATKLSALPWVKGPAQDPISGVATVKLADDEQFLGSAATNEFLQLLGYPPVQDSFTLAKKDLSWASVFHFHRNGYVKDDEKLDPDLLLKQLKEENQLANDERKRQGLEQLYLDGWFVSPRYDRQSNRLEWGTRIRDERGSYVVDFTIRLLGRSGVMAVTLLSSQENLEHHVAQLKTTLKGFSFNPGEKYSEFQQGDKVVESGLSALVVGEAVPTTQSQPIEPTIELQPSILQSIQSMFGSVGWPELIIFSLYVLVPIIILLPPLINGFCMWVHYRLVKSTQCGRETQNQVILPGAIRPLTSPRIGEGLPVLLPGQRLSMEFIRDPMQRVYLPFVLLPSVVLAIVTVVLVVTNIWLAGAILGGFGILMLAFWISWRLLYAYVLGHSIRVSETQYPQLYRLTEQASNILTIKTPTTFIMQGHGFFETLVAKRFSRRGLIILTSNLVDDLTERGASRELMFFIGRQLGLIATGYFRFWFIKSLGRIALPFYLAWERRCHLTADRIGLLVAGELHAAEQALVTITAGSAVAPSTSVESLEEQRHDLFRAYWSWVRLLASSYPFMIDRILRIRQFADEAVKTGIHAQQPVGALPIGHGLIRSVPILLIHGHDTLSRLDLENFFFRKLPHVAPLSMILETDAAATLPEKFEELASQVNGAIAILSPDDMATTLRSGESAARARQNVVIEVGWFWGRLGRNRCLLLMKDTVEIPSDLNGVEIYKFRESPVERSEAIRSFVDTLSVA